MAFTGFQPNPNAPIPVGGQPVPDETTGLYAEQAGQIGPGVVRATYWEKFFNKAQEGLEDAASWSGFRHAQMLGTIMEESGSPGFRQLTPEEANKQYPGLAVPFKEPVSPGIAKIIADTQARRREREAWINTGPQDTGYNLPFGLNTFDLAAGLPQALDPINLAVNAGLAAATGGLGIAGRLGLGRLGKIGLSFAENYAGNLITEVPGYYQRQAEHEIPRTAKEILVTAGVGAVVGTAIHTAARALFGRAEATVSDVSESTKAQVTKNAINQHETGQRIDTLPESVRQIRREIGDAVPSNYRAIGKPGDIDYYVAIDPEGKNLTQMSDAHGGIVGVGNRLRANNRSGLPESHYNGKIVQARLTPDANLANGEAPFATLFSAGDIDTALERVAGIIDSPSKFNSYKEIFKAAIEQGASIADVFDTFLHLPRNKITPEGKYYTTDFNKVMDGLGYDGIAHVTRIGETPIDNQIVVWNEGKLDPVEIHDAVKDTVPDFMQSGASGLLDETGMIPPGFMEEGASKLGSDRNFDPEASSRLSKAASMSDETIKASKAESGPMADEQLGQAEAYLKERSAEPGGEHLKEAQTKIEEEYKAEMTKSKLAKDMITCMVGNFV